MSAALNSSTTLFCVVSGFPLATVTWLKDNSSLPSNLNYSNITLSATDSQSSSHFENLNASFTGDVGVLALLIILELHRGDNGTYSCHASNSLSETGIFRDVSDINLTVLGIMLIITVTKYMFFIMHFGYRETSTPRKSLCLKLHS